MGHSLSLLTLNIIIFSSPSPTNQILTRPLPLFRLSPSDSEEEKKELWLWSKADNSLQDRKRPRVTKSVMEERRKLTVSWIARGEDLTIQASTVDYKYAISHYWLLSKIAESLSIFGCPRMAVIDGLCDQWVQISAILHQYFI